MKTRPDFYFLNKDSRTFLSRGHLDDNETPEERYLAIANAAEKILGIEGYAEKLYGYIKRGYYSLATPVFTNFGGKRGLPVSCFGSKVEDTLPSILGKAAEVGMMSKGGGGTSADFSSIRSRGSKISAGGESSGPVHFMEIFDSVSETVSQGSTRRGSFAAYLPVEHPDILEFLKIRSDGHKIQNLSIGVTLTDKWMTEMTDGCPEKRKIWSKIIQKRCETGYPYLFFTDTVNNGAPEVYKDGGLKVNASNLCLTGDALIQIRHEGKELTVKIQWLEFYMDSGIEVKSFNTETGKDVYSKVTDFAQTGVSSEIIEIEDTDGNIIKCTPEHKIFTKNKGYVSARFLKEDDIIKSTGQIRKITRYHHVEPVYDITVEGTENFYANNILVHNCSEICLPSNGVESFTCVLSSLNLLYWEEIKETDAVETLAYFLDAVNEEFIRKARNIPFMAPAVLFAENHRALGLGILGWHSLLQSKMIAFESMEAKMLNVSIFRELKERTTAASVELAKLLGEPALLKGLGRRNTTLMAIAPTTSSSFVLGQVSPSIEPLNSNYFVKDLAKGKFTYTNPFLRKLLADKGQNSDAVWESILLHGGSVQHLQFLSEGERDVFKTFGEISQKEVVIQAAARQKYIDQSQSLNLMVPPHVKPKEISDLLIEGWRLGIKTFYYQRSANPAQELGRSIMTCKSCEG